MFVLLVESYYLWIAISETVETWDSCPSNGNRLHRLAGKTKALALALALYSTAPAQHSCDATTLRYDASWKDSFRQWKCVRPGLSIE
ncbi:hypothetical protein HZ326_8238 [Fusarium oxysporum f. sp. albedinis]|nr:hypothetical protein HZ326_8238 [Fusarium oxysporum f. sp. albedinis]